MTGLFESPGEKAARRSALIDVLYIGDDRRGCETAAAGVAGHAAFRLRCANSSEAALEVCGSWSPGIVLLDDALPGLDIPRTLAQLRQLPNMAEVAVIILSAEALGSDLDGIAGVIGNPFDPATLWPQINSLLLQRLRGLEKSARDLDHQLLMLEAAYQAPDSGVVILDGAGAFLRWNEVAEHMSNLRAADAVGRNYREFIPPGQIEHNTQIVKRIQNGETVKFETQWPQKDGALVEVSLKVSPFRDRAGSIAGAVCVARNISVRKALEAALQVSDARHTQVVQAMSVGVWERDIKTGQSFWSDRMKELLGLPQEFASSPYEFEARLHPDDRDATMAAWQRHLRERTPYDVEYRMRKHDGDYIWLRATAQAAWDALGNPTRVIGSIDDIGRRKDAEAKLRAVNQSLEAKVAVKAAQLQIIVDAMPNMVVYWDHELRCGFANAACLHWFGRSRPQDILGHSMQSVLGDALFAKNEKFIRAALNGERRSFERWQTRLDGSAACTWISYVPDQAPGGKVHGLVAIGTDITPILEANLRATQSDARYRLLADSSSDLVVQLDRDLVRRYVSPACREVLGYEEADLLDKTHLELIHPDDVDQFRQACAQLLDGVAEHCQTTLRKRHRDGHWLWIETTMRAYRDPETGQIAGIVKALRDISARKAIEGLLNQRTEQLEAANQESQSFAYAAAHDIKAPLRAIGNFATWLEEDLQPFLTAETRGHFTRLRDRVIRLQTLLEDLLQFSRIGREGGRNEIISGTELMDNVLALLPEDEAFVLTASGFAAIRIARMPLQQILMNLAGNAIKHHDKTAGRIEISAEDLGTHYAFAVRDDGPGIPSRFHAQIFKMFETLKPRDQVEGSGMGLAIVRKQIELSGGTLALDSVEGQGSTFRFTLPAPVPDKGREMG